MPALQCQRALTKHTIRHPGGRQSGGWGEIPPAGRMDPHNKPGQANTADGKKHRKPLKFLELLGSGATKGEIPEGSLRTTDFFEILEFFPGRKFRKKQKN